MLLSRCKAWLSVVSAAVGLSLGSVLGPRSSILDPRSSIVDERTLTAAAAAAAALRFLLAAPQRPSQQLPTFMSWSWIQTTRLRAARGQSARVRVCKMSTVGANGPTCITDKRFSILPICRFSDDASETRDALGSVLLLFPAAQRYLFEICQARNPRRRR